MAIALLLGMLRSTPARAQSGLPLELSWDAPAECPSADDVHTELARIAHARPGHVLEPLRAEARVRRDHRRYLLDVHTEHQGRAGERRVDAKDCKTLVRTLTLILALTFGAGVELAEESAETPQAPPAEAAPAPSPAPAPAPPPPTPSPAPPAPLREARVDAARPRWFVLAGPELAWKLAPRVAPGVVLGAGLTHGWLMAQLRASAFAAPVSTVGPGMTARFAGGSARLSGCGQVPFWQLSGALCAGAGASFVHGKASGASEDLSATAPWYTAQARASLRAPRNARLQGELAGGFDVSLNRPRFVIEGLGEIHQVSRLVPSLSLGLLFAL